MPALMYPPLPLSMPIPPGPYADGSWGTALTDHVRRCERTFRHNQEQAEKYLEYLRGVQQAKDESEPEKEPNVEITRIIVEPCESGEEGNAWQFTGKHKTGGAVYEGYATATEAVLAAARWASGGEMDRQAVAAEEGLPEPD